MNEQHPLQSFIDLVTFDQELISLEIEIKKLEHEIADANSKIVQIEQASQHAHDRVRTARKEVDEKELEMKELDAQQKKNKTRLEQAKTTKEYQALTTEKDGLKKMQGQLDEQLLSAWHTFETVQKECALLVSDAERKLVEQKELQQSKQNRIEDLKKRLIEFTRQRVEKEQGVPADWMERYAMMRSRVADPVVPVLHNGCGACFWPIAHQDMLELKRGALLQCKGCYRFLYVPKESVEQEK